MKRNSRSVFPDCAPTLTGTIVRRTANLSFKSDNYDTVKGILYSLHSLKYRCTIQDVSNDAGGKDSLSGSDEIYTTLSITFYETIEGAANTNGLVITEDESESNVFQGDATYN